MNNNNNNNSSGNNNSGNGLNNINPNVSLQDLGNVGLLLGLAALNDMSGQGQCGTSFPVIQPQSMVQQGFDLNQQPAPQRFINTGRGRGVPMIQNPGGLRPERMQTPRISNAGPSCTTNSSNSGDAGEILSNRILSRLGPEIDRPEHQEKMFLPPVIEDLDESSLRHALLGHLQPIIVNTGVRPYLRGGSGTPDRLHFYVAHQNEKNFLEAKRMIVVLVQTVVAEMQELMREDNDDIQEIPPSSNPEPRTLEDALAMIRPGMSQEKKQFVESAIKCQQSVFEQKLRHFSSMKPHELPPMLLSANIADAAFSPEELKVRKEMDQLQKSVDILSRINDGNPITNSERSMMAQFNVYPIAANIGPVASDSPGIMSHQLRMQQQHQSSGIDSQALMNMFPSANGDMSRLTKVQKKQLKKMIKIQKHEMRLQKEMRQLQQQLRPSSVPVIDLENINSNNVSRGDNMRASSSTSNTFDAPPPPANMINPALDYLYNPHVVKGVNNTSGDISSALQVGYLPELENAGGEDPYSELLTDNTNKNNKNKEERRSRREPRKSNETKHSVDRHHHRREHHRRHNTNNSHNNSLHSHHKPPFDRTEIEEKLVANQKREKSLERRERSLERRERKEREERRIRYERYERERRYEQAKRERELWERSEQQRRERYERETRYMQDYERVVYERYERERRERFEWERQQWEQREREKLRRELEEETEAEKEASVVGRTGVPVVYASNVCPSTDEATLHKHFSRFGTVTRVVLIRTRQKNVLQSEIYFEKWAHTNRAVNTIPGAHLIDGYPVRVSHERFQLVCPITRMDELKVSKKPESFDEILRKYKMQADIKKGKSGVSDSPTAQINPQRSALNGLEKNTEKNKESDRPAEEIMPVQEVRFVDKEQGRPSNGPVPAVAESPAMIAAKVALRPSTKERTKKLTLVLDSDMAYFDEDLVTQCKYQVLSGVGVTVRVASDMFHQHWQQLQDSNTFNSKTHYQIYVVIPSMGFLVQHIVGDGMKDALDGNHISNGFVDSLEYQNGVKKYLKETRKSFKKISSKDSSFYPDEVKQWIDSLHLAYEDVDSFMLQMKEDNASIRDFLDLKQRVKSVMKSLEEEGKLGVKDEKDDDESEISVEKVVTLAGDDNTESEPGPLVSLFEVLAQKIRVAAAPIVTLDSDGECEDTTDVRKARQTDPGETVRQFLLRRMLHEAFMLRRRLNTNAALAYTTFALDWVSPDDVKAAVAHIRRQKVMQQKEQLEQLVSYLFHSVRLFNAFSRVTWMVSGCKMPLVEDLRDTLREEGEVEEEGEVDQSVEPSEERKKLQIEMKKVEEEKKKIEEEKKQIEMMRKSLEDEKKKKNMEDEARRAEERVRLQEMEEMKKRLQDELLAMGVDMGENIDVPNEEVQENLSQSLPEDHSLEHSVPLSKTSTLGRILAMEKTSDDTPVPAKKGETDNSVVDPITNRSNKDKYDQTVGETRTLPKISSNRMPSLFMLPNQGNRDIFKMPQTDLPSCKRLELSPRDDILPERFESTKNKNKRLTDSSKAKENILIHDTSAFVSGYVQLPAGGVWGPGTVQSEELNTNHTAWCEANTAHHQRHHISSKEDGPVSKYATHNSSNKGKEKPNKLPGADTTQDYNRSFRDSTHDDTAPRAGEKALSKSDNRSFVSSNTTSSSQDSIVIPSTLVSDIPLPPPSAPLATSSSTLAQPTATISSVPTENKTVSVYSSLRRSMNAKKKLSKEEIQKLIAPSNVVTPVSFSIASKALDSVVSVNTNSVESTKSVNNVVGSVNEEAVTEGGTTSGTTDPDPGDAAAAATSSTLGGADWFTNMMSAWSRPAAGAKAGRNKGGYLMTNANDIPPSDEEQDQKQVQQNKKKRKPRKKNLENEIRKAACEGYAEPEKRIGPNAAQWHADEADFQAGIVPGKGELLPEIEPIKKQKKQTKKVIPIPYKRYIPDNHKFRELLYCYKHKQKEHQRKQQLLKKQKKNGEVNKDEATQLESVKSVSPDELLRPLKRTQLAICSFVVRLTMSPREFPVKWAEDIAHVFGLQFAPVRDPPTGGWLFPSNEAEDASALLKMLNRLRLLDSVLRSSLHTAAAPLPKLAPDTRDVLQERLQLFAEKYDNTAARNLQPSISQGETCSFFSPTWRHTYLGDLELLYSTVADAVRSLAKKQSVSTVRRWSSGGLRVLVVVADVSVAVWCGGLVGEMAGKRGVSLVGGEELLLSDVEHADVVVGTSEQLLQIFNRNLDSSSRRHPLGQLGVIIYDDVDTLTEMPLFTDLLAIIKSRVQAYACVQRVAIARRVVFAELETAEQRLDCRFPRTALQDPQEQETELSEAAEEQMFLQQEKDYAEKQLAATIETEENTLTQPIRNRDSRKDDVTSKKDVKRQDERNPSHSRNNAIVKRSAGEMLMMEQPEAKKPRRLTFLEELELARLEQRNRKLEIVVLEDERKEKKELEKTMQMLKEQQKERLEEEYQKNLIEKQMLRKKNETRFNQILEENKAEEAIDEQTQTANSATAPNDNGQDDPSVTEQQTTDDTVHSQPQEGSSESATVLAQPTLSVEKETLETNSTISESPNTKETILEPTPNSEHNVLSLAEHLTLLRERSKSECENLQDSEKVCQVAVDDTPIPSEKGKLIGSSDITKEVEVSKNNLSTDRDGSVKQSKTESHSKNALTAKQIKKLEIRRKLEMEKRRLEQRIQQEMVKKQRRLETERQQLLQNKLLQEQKKRKKVLLEKLEQEELRKKKKMKQ